MPINFTPVKGIGLTRKFYGKFRKDPEKYFYTPDLTLKGSIAYGIDKNDAIPLTGGTKKIEFGFTPRKSVMSLFDFVSFSRSFNRYEEEEVMTQVESLNDLKRSLTQDSRSRVFVEK